MLREGSSVTFCNGTIYFRNATTQILRICQKFHFRSVEIINNCELDGNLAVFSGLSHEESVLPDTPPPNKRKTVFSILGKTASILPLPHPSKTNKFDTKFYPTRAEASHHRGLFCGRSIELLSSVGNRN